LGQGFVLIKKSAYLNLPDRFYEIVNPSELKNPRLLLWNDRLADELGLDSVLDKAEYFSGNRVFCDTLPVATAYAGHQFGHFVPQLGDGRAHLLGDVSDFKGRFFDLQLKGSGRSVFSRQGDGRCPLGPALREYIVSEAMLALGVPTTRSLAVVSSDDSVFRNKVEQAAVVTRVASSHIRVGTFEYFAARQDVNALKLLCEYAIQRHYLELLDRQNKVAEFFKSVCSKQAFLIAKWLSVGFIHGVMNTDNMSISGETIDFGPCAFLDKTHTDTVFSYIDTQGRYAYGNQAKIGAWNLHCLGLALWPLFSESDADCERFLHEGLALFQSEFSQYWLAFMTQKIGLLHSQSGDEDLVQDLLALMQEHQLDFTMTFRNLHKPNFLETCVGLKDWYLRWKRRLELENNSDSLLLMNEVNPVYIPRNHRVNQAITAAEQGNMQPVKVLLQVLSNPYFEQESYTLYASPPNESERVRETFCGT
jgi:uncharacterized protein YdiU (UPF0061 family)